MVDFEVILISMLLAINAVMVVITNPIISTKRKEEIVFDIAYSLVWDAERIWGSKSGHIKRIYVKAKLYIILSGMSVFRNSLIKKESIECTIDKAVELMQNYISEEQGK